MGDVAMGAKGKITVQDFEVDIIAFIRDHKYLKEQDTTAEVDTSNYDEVKILIHTVDGDFERIGITITYLA